MRNPSRKAGLYLLAALAGAGLIWFGTVRQEQAGDHWSSLGPLGLGFAVAPFALVFLIQSLVSARGLALLLAGRRVLARWHVDAAEWDRFRALDSRRAAEHPSLINDLSIRKQTPPLGVEVLVGETSLLVDGSYHVLRPGGMPALRGVAWLDAAPLGLEFSVAYPRGRSGGTLPLTLRIPVPRGSIAPAQRVIDHFEPLTRPRPAIALRRPKLTIVLSLVVALLAAAAAAAGFMLAGSGDQGQLPVAMAVAGTIVAPAALLLAVATALLSRGR